MSLQALLVSKDDAAADVLCRVLASFGVAVERFSEIEIALQRLAEHRFDSLIVDFDEPETANQLLQASSAAKPATVVTLALLKDESAVRQTLKSGAKFILHKPLSDKQAAAALRAVTAMLRRERRRAFRVAVQLPIQIGVPGGDQIEGIVLDLSQTGMDMLAAQPLHVGLLIGLRFVLPDGGSEMEAHGEIAWANANGQAGVRFLEMPEAQAEQLKAWLLSNTPEAPPDDAEPVSVCKLTDLSLGGCYVETESPFPEHALVDLCLKAANMEIHAEGMVRVMHPHSGMGLEFPSRTREQRETVAQFIDFLTSRPGTVPELLIAPKSLVADESQFEKTIASEDEHVEDPLLELLRNGESLTKDQFVTELQRQRSSEALASS